MHRTVVGDNDWESFFTLALAGADAGARTLNLKALQGGCIGATPRHTEKKNKMLEELRVPDRLCSLTSGNPLVTCAHEHGNQLALGAIAPRFILKTLVSLAALESPS